MECGYVIILEMVVEVEGEKDRGSGVGWDRGGKIAMAL